VHQLVAVPWDPWGSEKSWFYRTLLDPFRVDDVDDDDDDGDDGDDDDSVSLTCLMYILYSQVITCPVDIWL